MKRRGPKAGLGGLLIQRLKELGMVFCAPCFAYLPPGHDCRLQLPAMRTVNPTRLFDDRSTRYV